MLIAFHKIFDECHFLQLDAVRLRKWLEIKKPILLWYIQDTPSPSAFYTVGFSLKCIFCQLANDVSFGSTGVTTLKTATCQLPSFSRWTLCSVSVENWTDRMMRFSMFRVYYSTVKGQILLIHPTLSFPLCPQYILYITLSVSACK